MSYPSNGDDIGSALPGTIIKEISMVIRFGRMVALTLPFLFMLVGCATNVGVPQTRDEFVSAYKSGGMFRNAEHIVVNRPVKTVVADVSEYASKCLKVRVTHGPSYKYKEAGGSTIYLPKIESTRNGATALSVQERYNDRVQSGAPPGGIFTLVAEIRAAGSNKTQVDIYHASRDKIADPLKQWIQGGNRQCPSLERGW
jgi:hypothetical protein